MNLQLISVEYGMRIKAVMTYKPKLLLQMNCGRKKNNTQKFELLCFIRKMLVNHRTPANKSTFTLVMCTGCTPPLTL